MKSNWCSQCGQPLIRHGWTTMACGPTHACMAAELETYYKHRVMLGTTFAQRCPICFCLVIDDHQRDEDWDKHVEWHKTRGES